MCICIHHQIKHVEQARIVSSSRIATWIGEGFFLDALRGIINSIPTSPSPQVRCLDTQETEQQQPSQILLFSSEENRLRTPITDSVQTQGSCLQAALRHPSVEADTQPSRYRRLLLIVLERCRKTCLK